MAIASRSILLVWKKNNFKPVTFMKHARLTLKTNINVERFKTKKESDKVSFSIKTKFTDHE
jgi:hypothetical protein